MSRIVHAQHFEVVDEVAERIDEFGDEGLVVVAPDQQCRHRHAGGARRPEVIVGHRVRLWHIRPIPVDPRIHRPRHRKRPPDRLVELGCVVRQGPQGGVGLRPHGMCAVLGHAPMRTATPHRVHVTRTMALIFVGADQVKNLIRRRCADRDHRIEALRPRLRVRPGEARSPVVTNERERPITEALPRERVDLSRHVLQSIVLERPGPIRGVRAKRVDRQNAMVLCERLELRQEAEPAGREAVQQQHRRCVLGPRLVKVQMHALDERPPLLVLDHRCDFLPPACGWRRPRFPGSLS